MKISLTQMSSSISVSSFSVRATSHPSPSLSDTTPPKKVLRSAKITFAEVYTVYSVYNDRVDVIALYCGCVARRSSCRQQWCTWAWRTVSHTPLSLTPPSSRQLPLFKPKLFTKKTGSLPHTFLSTKQITYTLSQQTPYREAPDCAATSREGRPLTSSSISPLPCTWLLRSGQGWWWCLA